MLQPTLKPQEISQWPPHHASSFTPVACCFFWGYAYCSSAILKAMLSSRSGRSAATNGRQHDAQVLGEAETMQCQATATLQDCRLLSHSRGALRSVVKVPSLPTLLTSCLWSILLWLLRVCFSKLARLGIAGSALFLAPVRVCLACHRESLVQMMQIQAFQALVNFREPGTRITALLLTVQHLTDR